MNLITAFVLVWDLMLGLRIVHDIRQPSLKGPFNSIVCEDSGCKATLLQGCHWRVDQYFYDRTQFYGSRTYRDVLCYHLADPQELLPVRD